MKLDLAAGIHIYLCWYSSVKDVISTPDFGITDDSYVCLVYYDKKTKKASEIELNSSDDALEMSRKWKVAILNHSIEVKDLTKDTSVFLHTRHTV